MKLIELVKISTKVLEMVSENGIKASDYKYVTMYEEYRMMRAAGEKYSYVVAFLAEKYKTSESSVKRLIRRLSQEVIF